MGCVSSAKDDHTANHTRCEQLEDSPDAYTTYVLAIRLCVCIIHGYCVCIYVHICVSLPLIAACLILCYTFILKIKELRPIKPPSSGKWK